VTGATPILGLPFAQGGDPFSAWPGVSQALAEKLEQSEFAGFKPMSAPQTEYPLGVSVMRVTAAQATDGGWPDNLSCVVHTLRREGGDAAYQYWLRTSSLYPEIRYRAWAPGYTWGRWITVATLNTARAQHAGEYTFDASASNKSKTLAWPAGLFTTRPYVVVSGSTRDATMTATGITATGFSVNMGPEAGANSIARRVTWIAIEMNGVDA